MRLTRIVVVVVVLNFHCSSTLSHGQGDRVDTNTFKSQLLLVYAFQESKLIFIVLSWFWLKCEVDEMGLFKFLKPSVFLVIMVVGALISSAESTILVHFDRSPSARSRFSTAVFQYSIKRPDASVACQNNDCFLHCQLDGQILRNCPTDIIVFKNLRVNSEHEFLLNVTTRNGERNSSTYLWFIDTIPPTATISSRQNYTNAEKITIDINFSEACTGQGGFKCINSSNCDVILDGPAYVHESSLRIIKPYIRYSLDIVLSSKSTYGRVVIRMVDNVCTDIAGNNFTRTNGSTVIIHIDRRPVLVDFWMSLPAYELEINGVPRTVLATKDTKDLEIFLDFSIPIINSTEQILNAFHLNSGNLIAIQTRSHMNRRFVCKLKIVQEAEIITVELQASLLIGISGAPVSPVPSIAFLYDSTRPGVGLSTSSPSITKAPNINVIVEFTKPVFGFEASMVDVNGGRLTRQVHMMIIKAFTINDSQVLMFKQISRALYSLNVQASTQNVVSISIPAEKVNDISGNLNLASNKIEVKHYSTPAISTALHSFVTAGVLATSLAAAILSLSSANLGATSTHSSGFSFVASDPSMNLHGMVGHLQVFVLSDWLTANQPIEYSETTKGLRWLIPRQKLPWRKDSASLWPNHVYFAKEKLLMQFGHLSIGYAYRRSYHQAGLNLTNSSYTQHQLFFPTAIDPKFGWPYGHRNLSMKNTPYGLPLSSNEYFTYFLRGEPLSSSNVVKKMENYKGWLDLGMNLFWLAVGGFSLLSIHALTLLFLRWRIGTSVHGILSVPRFELFLLILMLPCISQSAAFVLRGATTGGIIIGALLLSIPAALILSVCLFLMIAIFLGSFAQYKEIRHVAIKEPWYTKLWFFFTGRPVNGKWFYKEGLPSSFFALFGILFENRKGPPLFVFVNENYPNTIPNWTESEQGGIGRMRAVSSDDSNEETRIPPSRRILGCARSSYIVLDLLRRTNMGIISGAYSSNHSSQSLFALTITLIQLTCLFTLKPYIRRGVHVVESISLLCEVGVFSLCIRLNGSNPTEAKTLGFLMLALLFLTFVAQITNEWYAMIQFILRLSQPQKNSFKVGLKFVAKGLVLPFLPRKHWPRVMPGSFQPITGLVPVLPLSPETEYGRRDARGPSAMTATVVPVLSPGSPGPNVIEMSSSTPVDATISRQREAEGKRGKGVKLETKSEMKKLRELAKASFSGDSTGEEASTSYAYRLQSSSPETSSANPQASTSKFRH
ncbi:hypothetical protein EZV62_020132 [Acer yangbiense]|uniref:Bacterial Ig-like domain-containing protein n=1 Tax=Acer yangbiense TaxID=1000413 RepID=A0A5C7HFA8_9ROSI|nr:hypothetical protein EZV62_020132 [Acer yangbiense]